MSVEYTDCFNECLVYDNKQSDVKISVILKVWKMQNTHSLPSFLCPFCPWVIAHEKALCLGQIELNCVLILNWIAWKRTALTFKLRIYANLNCLKWNCFGMRNSVVWNRIIWWNWIAWNVFHTEIVFLLLWTPTHGCARVGRPARTYIHQLCEDTGCNPEDLPEAMNDREKWRETVRDIGAGGATWWWWWC